MVQERDETQRAIGHHKEHRDDLCHHVHIAKQHKNERNEESDFFHNNPPRLRKVIFVTPCWGVLDYHMRISSDCEMIFRAFF